MNRKMMSLAALLSAGIFQGNKGFKMNFTQTNHDCPSLRIAEKHKNKRVEFSSTYKEKLASLHGKEKRKFVKHLKETYGV